MEGQPLLVALQNDRQEAVLDRNDENRGAITVNFVYGMLSEDRCGCNERESNQQLVARAARSVLYLYLCDGLGRPAT